MPPKLKFQEGEKVLCFHGVQIYEAKCLKAETKDKQNRYYIHYAGWKKRWDEWVPENQVLKYNKTNVKKQEVANQKANLQKNKKDGKESLKPDGSGSSSSCGDISGDVSVGGESESGGGETESGGGETGSGGGETGSGGGETESGASSPSTEKPALLKPAPVPDTLPVVPKRKRGRPPHVDRPVEQEEPVTKVEVKVKIPEELKPWLVDDWDLIFRQKKLVNLPAKISVKQILQDYLEYETSSNSNMPGRKNAIVELTNGIKEYFNVMLGTQLLYKFERPQYAELLVKHPDKALTEIYGAMHLLRLFVKFGSVLVYTPLDQQSIEVLVTHLQEFLKYLHKLTPSLFSLEDYGIASAEYRRKAM